MVALMTIMDPVSAGLTTIVIHVVIMMYIFHHGVLVYIQAIHTGVGGYHMAIQAIITTTITIVGMIHGTIPGMNHIIILTIIRIGRDIVMDIMAVITMVTMAITMAVIMTTIMSVIIIIEMQM